MSLEARWKRKRLLAVWISRRAFQAEGMLITKASWWSLPAGLGE